MVAAILCIWLFVGMPLWVPANENDAEIVTDDGQYLTRCFSHKSDERHIERDQFGLWNGIANTIVFCMCSFYGKWKQNQVASARQWTPNHCCVCDTDSALALSQLLLRFLAAGRAGLPER